ncbi:MAG: TolC family protein, partial [Acidobacteriota bacterium]|nr:TolC family protein [Acidobacteriota bacterium]
VQVGVRLPIFNRNQGNIGAARAELTFAESEVQRQQLVLRARMASVFRAYLNSLRLVERYQKNVLPRTQKTYNLYLASFKQMAAAYPQVLIARRTMFQTRVDYVNALVELHQNAIRIQGLLLTGGLDAPGSRNSETGIETGRMPGNNSGMQNESMGGNQDRREQ